ncbi:DUF4189 domain-containing protein [Pseudoduganella chitinolytica]|uniref:DUF4189 domain-containing protein n=1 Tax=Pseudoduganella chitinolytica TaxID=34070 RepID=A0ABY8BCB7_9BURK|nr:DUF4189 domain-containing protein [Pseudoduganella chitinolytica]WEF32823.1 DUF4189 domain-containing protein [Pseudoduganella chitinolytica]
MKKIALALLSFLSMHQSAYAADSHGALAVDRADKFQYGFAYDYDRPDEARDRALDECGKRSQDCAVVLEFSGKGCVAYATVPAEQGDAFGWGTGRTKAQAKQQAREACEKESAGQACSHNVWACNGKGSRRIRVELDPALQQAS